MSMDRASAEHLLREGRSRHAHDPLAALLTAASAPGPVDRELPGEAAALAAFRAARTAPRPPRRFGALRGTLTRMLSVKVAAFGVIATAGVGSVALVTVTSPLEHSGRGTRPAATARTQSGATQALPPAVAAPPSDAAVLPGPEVSAGQRGRSAPSQLCRELTGMDDRQRDRALRDVRYHDLVRDAGGTDRVDTFCSDRQSAASPSPQHPGSRGDSQDDLRGGPGDGDRSRDRDSPPYRDDDSSRENGPSRDGGSSRDGGQNGYPGGRPSTPPSVSPAPKPPPQG
ncbi:hypothetical protein ACIA8K_02560 [Catenuloplanes sp. NPDC051500]|uniref:hypothetical protein n=1 Tax=Catenuloplanes sp. NPDC051500 TaxID=3363959 RepID=UPI00378F3F0D